VTIEAVVFDWGGTLTPWHNVDLHELWLGYSNVYDPANAHQLAATLNQGEQERWLRQFETNGEVGTGVLDELFHEASVDTSSPLHFQALESYLSGWDPHTYTDPDAVELLEGLRGRGIKTAVLSNTMWPRTHHEAVLERDGVLHLFDYLLFTSETPAGKPHKSVFADVLYNLDVEPANAAFVGDRLFDDIHGAQSLGMKGIWIPHSNIPVSQSTDLGITPDATVQRLGEVMDVITGWSSQ